jgi:hypothetical protein
MEFDVSIEQVVTCEVPIRKSFVSGEQDEP